MILQPNEDHSSVSLQFTKLLLGFHKIPETLIETFLSSPTDCFMSKLEIHINIFAIWPTQQCAQLLDSRSLVYRGWHKNPNSLLILNPFSPTQRNIKQELLKLTQRQGANFECKAEQKTKVNLVQIILSSTLEEKLVENPKQIWIWSRRSVDYRGKYHYSN